MPPLRSRTVTHGRNMTGARALMRASGVAREDIGKPIVAVANSFTEFVPGHVHLREVGQVVSAAVKAAGAIPREFNTIAVDDGIAMRPPGHALLPAVPGADRGRGGDHGHGPLLRRPHLRLQLRQDHPRHGHGRPAGERAGHLRDRGADAGRGGAARRGHGGPGDRVRGGGQGPDRRHVRARTGPAGGLRLPRPAAPAPACSRPIP